MTPRPGFRRPSLLVAATLFSAAPPPVSGQAPPSPRDQLIAADRAASDSTTAAGLATGLPAFMAEDAVLLYPGAPVLDGITKIRTFLSAQPPSPGVIRWQPLAAEVSARGDFGVLYGVFVLAAPSAAGPGVPPIRIGRYHAGWRRTGNGLWRMISFGMGGVIRPAEAVVPPSIQPLELPAVSTDGVAGRFAAADIAFARLAGQKTAAEAFYAFAAPDAVTFAATGTLNRGPAEIRNTVADGPGESSRWSWVPVFTAGSADGDLGLTVGQSVIWSRSADGAENTGYGKYITLWRRQVNGEIRFISDGGSARPAPTGH